MNVVFYLNNIKKTLLIEESAKRNPGLGGAQFEVCMVATMLNRFYGDISITVCTDCEKVVSNEIEVIYCEKPVSLFDEVKKRNAILIFNQIGDANFYNNLRKTDICSIIWVHNYLTYEIYSYILKTDNIKKIVFVGQQLYDHYIDSPIIKKSTFIFNCIPKAVIQPRYSIDNEARRVVYVGNLSRVKGFHKLARVWKKILRQCPGTELYILGGGLYGDLTELNRYTAKCRKYLSDKKGNLLPGVHFMGTLGREKDEIIRRATVGVANPTGKTETFCLSAVEFEACGIPVVSFRGLGLLDTVVNGETGYLIKTDKELVKRIVLLINNDDVNWKFGENGKKYVKKFTEDYIIPQWIQLFKDIENGEPVSQLFSGENMGNDFKWLRYLSFRLQGGKGRICVAECAIKVKSSVKRMIH